MRELDPREMMSIRMALQREAKALEGLWKSAGDPTAIRSYRDRLDRLEGLRETFRPGAKVAVAV